MRFLLIISVPLLVGLFACTGPGPACGGGIMCPPPSPEISAVVTAITSAMPSTGVRGSCSNGGQIIATTVGGTSCSSSSPGTGTQPGSSAQPMAGMSSMPVMPAASTMPVAGGLAYYQNCYGNCPGNVNPAGLVQYVKPPNAQFHEFQVNCPVFEHIPDDPIVDPGKPGAAHNHAFFGNTGANAFSTLASLTAAPKNTTCSTEGDYAAYWMPTLYSFAGASAEFSINTGMPAIPTNAAIVDPLNHTGANGSTIIYYKAGTSNYTAVIPFPPGFKMVVGWAKAVSPDSFHGFYSCTPGLTSLNFPPNCPPGNKLIVRLQAPSCWDGVNLDSPTHNTHIVYPSHDSCPLDHPVFLPMLEFKIPYVVDGINMSTLLFSSGGPYSFHYDFFNAWEVDKQAALVTHCINGGRQCDAQGVGNAGNP